MHIFGKNDAREITHAAKLLRSGTKKPTTDPDCQQAICCLDW